MSAIDKKNRQRRRKKLELPSPIESFDSLLNPSFKKNMKYKQQTEISTYIKILTLTLGIGLLLLECRRVRRYDCCHPCQPRGCREVR